MSPIVNKYVSLINRFVTGEITAPQFEVLYLNMFKAESEMLPDQIYIVLNQLFLDIDAYCSDPNLRDEGTLGDAELLTSAKEALERLTRLGTGEVWEEG